MAIEQYSYGNDKGYVVESDSIYGNEKGYLYTVQPLLNANVQSNQYIMQFSVKGNSDTQPAVRKALFNYDNVSNVMYENYQLSIILTLPNRDYYAILDDVVDTLKENELVSVCPQSGSTHDLGIYKSNGRLAILNEQAFEKMDSSLKQKLGFQNNKFFLGLLGGIVGALGGLAIWMVLGQFNIVASFAGFAIVAFSFKGYEIIVGRLSKKAVITLLIIDVIFVLIAPSLDVIIYNYIELKKSYGATFMQVVSIFFEMFGADSKLRNTVIMNTIVGLLFFGLGSFRLVQANLRVSSIEYKSEKLL